MSLSIDVSSIANDSPEIVKNFLKKSFIKKLDIETIAFLNSKLKLLNQQGILKLEELKCNFDVEIGRDMLSDFNEDKYETYVLWSGDSDFHGPISQLIDDEKKVVIFSISGRIASEIDELGIPIFDVRKIKEFICWPRELSESIKSKIGAYIKAKGTPQGGPSAKDL
ncbi:MAG: NYN domain-containing protein [Patescibacteria group bacterium]